MANIARYACRHLPGSSGEGLKILEVGAGTGRFSAFMRDNYPYATLTVSELSPFYLEKAREELQYWEAPNTSTSRSTGELLRHHHGMHACPPPESCASCPMHEPEVCFSACI